MQAKLNKKKLYFLPLTFTLTDKAGNASEFKDEFQTDKEYVDYYNKVRSGLLSRTSMNSPAVHEEHFLKMAKDGVKKAIHFTISYGLCRTVDVARDTVKKIQESYPDFDCLCVECSTTTVGQGLLVNIATDMRDKGKELKETFDYIESIKRKIQHFIVVDDLKSLVRGGRISATAGVVGGMLQVKPIIVFNKEGKLQKYKQSTGLKHTISVIVKEFEHYTLNKDYPIIYVGHTDNMPMATLLKDKLQATYNVNPEIRMIGPVIGSHLGPNAVAYAFLSNEERPI